MRQIILKRQLEDWRKSLITELNNLDVSNIDPQDYRRVHYLMVALFEMLY